MVSPGMAWHGMAWQGMARQADRGRHGLADRRRHSRLDGVHRLGMGRLSEGAVDAGRKIMGERQQTYIADKNGWCMDQGRDRHLA